LDVRRSYVALSRVRSLAGLTVLDFDLAKIRAAPEVVAYYTQIEEAEDLAPADVARAAAARRSAAPAAASWTTVAQGSSGRRRGAGGWAHRDADASAARKHAGAARRPPAPTRATKDTAEAEPPRKSAVSAHRPRDRTLSRASEDTHEEKKRCARRK
jgi:hypothetical protein